MLINCVSNDPIAFGRCAKLESAARYLRIVVKYAPEMTEPTAICYVLLAKAFFNGLYSPLIQRVAWMELAESRPCLIFSTFFYLTLRPDTNGALQTFRTGQYALFGWAYDYGELVTSKYEKNMRIHTNTDNELKIIHRPMGWFLVTLCFTVVNLSAFTSEILSGRNIEGNILYGSITFFGCLVMLRAFSRKSVVSFKANTKTVEYSVEYFFRKKFGTLSLDEIEKITEIETPGFGSDPKCYRLALVTTAGTIVPLSYTDDNITDHTKLINLVNEWLRRMNQAGRGLQPIRIKLSKKSVHSGNKT